LRPDNSVHRDRGIDELNDQKDEMIYWLNQGNVLVLGSTANLEERKGVWNIAGRAPKIGAFLEGQGWRSMRWAGRAGAAVLCFQEPFLSLEKFLLFPVFLCPGKANLDAISSELWTCLRRFKFLLSDTFIAQIPY
jgi:hypothetical protein